MIRIAIVISLFVLSLPIAGQKKAVPNKSALPDKDLHIAWEMIENNYRGQGKFQSAFTLTNKSKKSWPAAGWKLYFNLARAIDTNSVTGGMRIVPVNGDLFYLTPGAGFSGLKRGDSLHIEFVSADWAVNATDAPAGLFWVWDAQPNVGQKVSRYSIKPSTQPKQYLRTAGDKVPFITAQDIYRQNAQHAERMAEAKLIPPGIFPTPVTFAMNDGTFTLQADVSIVTAQDFQREAKYLSEELGRLFGKSIPVVTAGGSGKFIRLEKAATGPEAYSLSIKTDGITISAAEGAGIFYGIQSLKSLFPPRSWAPNPPVITLPALEVQDAPRFHYRAFMLDVGRNFQPKEEILKILDLLSLYKLNVFHFHFSEDEGWRIEMPSLPELTAIGGRRGFPVDESKQLMPSFGSGPDNNSNGSGYYTKADFIEILRYATERHIQVIPEIESPGHARAAVVSMKARYERLLKEGNIEEASQYRLHDPEDQSVYRSVQGWRDNVMNVALPSTYTFIKRVVDDLVDMYREAGAPLTTIHVGGDEVPAGVWERSPAVRELMKKDASVKTTDDLWYYYYGRVNDILRKRGLQLYGWEEAAMRKTMLDGNRHAIPNPDFVKDRFMVDVWNNVLGWGAEDLAYRLANAGYPVVLSPVSNLYFDMAYQKSFDEPGYYWGGYSDLDQSFKYIPYDYYKNSMMDRMGNKLGPAFFLGRDRLTDYGKQNIIGIQGLLWSETLLSAASMEYMLLPKLLGLSERAWAADPAWALEKDSAKAATLYARDWQQFVTTIGHRELPRLDHYAGGFHYRIPAPGGIIENGTLKANLQIPGFTIYYTTDGTEPTMENKIYKGPVPVSGMVRLKAFNGSNRSSRTVTIH